MLIFPSDFHSQKLNNKLSIQPSSICQYSALIVLLVIENEAKNRLVGRSLSLEKMTVTMHGVRNVPLSKILTVQLGFQMTHYYRTHRSMHWDIEISLSHSSHNKALYSLSSLVSLQLFLWMNAPPFSFTLLFLRGERATVSQCRLLSLHACLLSSWYQPFPLSRRQWPAPGCSEVRSHLAGGQRLPSSRVWGLRVCR